MSRNIRERSHCRSRDAGATLLELVVVLAIIAAVFALSATYFRGSARAVPLQPLAIRMAADLRMARATAMAQNRSVGVTINTLARSYQTDTGSTPVVLPRTIALSVVEAGGSQPGVDSAVIVFYPDGSATGGSLVVSDQRSAVQVLIDAMTGAVATQKVNR